MYKLTALNLENSYSITFNNGVYTIDSIEGLSPPEATINLTQMALVDGQLFNSAHVNYRTINLAFAIEVNAEQNRLAAYSVFKVKQPIKLTYESSRISVWIVGYVASVSVDHFAMKQVMTVQLICPFPWWSGDAVTVTHAGGFGANLDNDGDMETGSTISLIINGTVEDITLECYVLNTSYTCAMTITYSFESGDVVTINTIKGQKTATLTRGNDTINLLGYVSGDWLEYPQGRVWQNVSVGTGSASDITEAITITPLYEGV